MNKLHDLFDHLVTGSISTEERLLLEQTLDSDSAASDAFDDRMELESALGIWGFGKPLAETPCSASARPILLESRRGHCASWLRWTITAGLVLVLLTILDAAFASK